jgi:hypothetical protein
MRFLRKFKRDKWDDIKKYFGLGSTNNNS